MAAKKAKKPKPQKEKKPRDVLTRPIEYDLELVLMWYAKANSVPPPKGDRYRVAAQALMAQLVERYRALFDFYGISLSEPNAQFWLIIRMAMERFPSAFNCVRRGEKKRGNKAKWTPPELLRLWVLVQQLKSENPGLDDKGATKSIANENLLSGPPTAPQSMQQRYCEAKRMMDRFGMGPVTPFEALEFAKFLEGIQPSSLNDFLQLQK